MPHIFDIERTVRTYALYFSEGADVLRDLLRSVDRCLHRLLPPETSARIDREGSTAVRAETGELRVRRHPALEVAIAELARLDLFRLFLPRAYGGLELPVGIYYLAVQLIAYHDASLALTFLVHGNAMYVINRYGTEEQKGSYLPSLAAGEWLATVAFTEPQAGSDAGAIRTRATRDGDRYLLEGTKTWITHGGDADLLVTTARTGPLEEGIRGVSAFLVERERDGVELLGLEEKTGLGGSPTAVLGYPEIRIPADRILGPEGGGGPVMLAGVGMTRVNIGAQALGIGKRAFGAAVGFALEREQGGCRIVEHHAIQQRLAAMTFLLSAMENLICQVSFLEDHGEWHVREMSVTKYFCSEALQEVTLRAINVLGGYGVSTAYGAERCRREAVALPLFGGTSEIQWLIIARELLETVAGVAHANYRARDAETARALQARCQGPLVSLALRTEAVEDRLWAAVQEVHADRDPAPCYRPLADLTTDLAVAQVLLRQASAEGAGDLERELAHLAVDRLEARAATSRCVIEAQRAGRSLERVVRDMLRERE